MIPTILNNENIKFCKIKKGTKKPFETEWTKKPYSYNEMEEWLKVNDENYGVLCGYGNLAVIDSDNPAFQIAIESIFPETLRIKTGSGGIHNYFFIPDLKQKIILNLDDENKTHLGEVQSWGTQVVGAGSIHPNGNKYELLENRPIITLQCDDLFEKLKPFMKKDVEKTEANAFWENSRTPENSEIDNLSVSDIWGTAGLKKHGSEYYGCHPIHSSQGGMNFWINPLKNMWHCFRCNSGGGVLSAIGVKEGIIDCSEAQRGNLRGDNAKKCLEIARQKYGLKDITEKDEQGFYKHSQKNYSSKEEIKIIWDNELKNYVEEEKEWIIERLIPTKSVCVLTGKRGTLKTFITLHMAYSIASGNEFLNKFSTRMGKIIYLDKENGTGIMKQRTAMIKKGMEIEDNDKIGFICFSQLKIDRLNDMAIIENIIKEQKPILLIIDTYRRGISFDENDAGEVSKLFVDTLRPLVEKYDLSIILIHHDRKGNGEGGDEMDEIRGSSDLPNYADSIIKLNRNGSNLVLKQLKNRNAQEEPPMRINNEFGDDYVKFWYDGEFMKKDRAEMFERAIIEWITKNKIKEFETKEIKELALNKGIKKNNMHNALLNLQSKGIISQIVKGRYCYKI